MLKKSRGGTKMFNIAEETIEQMKNRPTLKGVEDRLNLMSDKQCLRYLEKIIKEANAMNYCYGSGFEMLQATLMHAEKVIENNMEEE